MRISALVLMAIALATSGCAAIKGQAVAEWPWPQNSDFPCTGRSTAGAVVCTDADALRTYLHASEFCRKLHNHYENGGRGSDAGKFSLGALGVLAGSVFAPISHGTAATAWSGLSGSVNALQMSMEETFSSSIAARRREAITIAVTTGQGTFTGEAQAKVVAAVNMALNCSLAPATADSESMRDLAAKPGTRK